MTSSASSSGTNGSQAAKVTVVESLYGNWEITQKSHDFRKKDATRPSSRSGRAGGEGVGPHVHGALHLLMRSALGGIVSWPRSPRVASPPRSRGAVASDGSSSAPGSGASLDSASPREGLLSPRALARRAKAIASGILRRRPIASRRARPRARRVVRLGRRTAGVTIRTIFALAERGEHRGRTPKRSPHRGPGRSSPASAPWRVHAGSGRGGRRISFGPAAHPARDARVPKRTRWDIGARAF